MQNTSFQKAGCFIINTLKAPSYEAYVSILVSRNFRESSNSKMCSSVNQNIGLEAFNTRALAEV